MAELPDLLARSLSDRYRLDRELGRGGMATVYLAHDLKHDRPVALKVLHPELAAVVGPERFQREIRLAARLQHPHILTVLDSGESADRLWFTMPYVEGESLRDRLTRERQLAVDEALRIIREAAQGLEYAHQHGVIHRDIKPENILLTSDGSTLVADFGIARTLKGDGDQLTQTGMAIGTPAYMSPEQATGERGVDARTDVYALGCVLYELLAGEPPFTGPTPQAVLMRAMTESPRALNPTRPAVPASLDAVITRATARTPADRFPSMAALAAALAPIATTTITPAAPLPATAVRPVTAGGRSWQVGRPLFAILVLGFVLGLGVLFAWRRNGASPTGATNGIKQIAVIPFENQGDSADEYFADGMTDEVRGKLATLPGLQVIAGSSAGQYKHSSKSPQQIAQELGAQYLLVGKIRWEKSGTGASRVRVSPELIEVASGRAPTTRWQQPFDASLTDVFQVQADIAGRVAQALNLALASGVQTQLAEKPTQNLAAYDAYLRGVEARNQGAAPGDLRRAITGFEQAVALDTSFVVAWAGLSEALSLYNGQVTPSDAVADRARQAAEKALALGPNRPEGYVSLGDYYRRSKKDMTAAVAEYAKALRLAPANAAVLRGTGIAEESMGRTADAIQHYQEAQRLDPRSVPTAISLANALHYSRRYAEAFQAVDVALGLTPASAQAIERKTMIYLSQGDLAGARRYLQSVPEEVVPTALVAYLATYYDLYWVLTDEQQSLMLRLSPGQFEDDRGSWGLAFAGVYDLHGDRQKARAYADSARLAFQDQLRGAPDDGQLHVLLGLALALMGRKDEAIQEGKKGLELSLPDRDRINGAYFQHQMARIYLLVGENDKALDVLESLLKAPYYLSPAWLKIDPNFDPVRKNPRFVRLVGS